MSQYIDQDDGVNIGRSFVIQADSIKVTDGYGNISPLTPTGATSVGKRDWAFFGDSRAFLSVTTPGSFNNFQRNVGIGHWVQAYSLGAVSLPSTLNFGVAGDSTDQMLARQPAAITAIKAAGCTNVLMIGSTNDQTQGNADQGHIRKNLRELVRNFKVAGINVVVMSETPRGTGTSSYELNTQVQRDNHYNMHLWMEKTLSKMCTVLNVWGTWIDATSGTMYYPKPGYTADGIHPSKIGAQAIGRVVGPALALITRQLGDFLESNLAYNASTNIGGTLTPNPMMTGTTGTFQNHTPIAGSQLATGWNATGDNLSTITALYTKEVDGEGVEWQKVKLTGVGHASGTNLNLENTLALGQLANGNNIKMTNMYRSRGVGLSNVANEIVLIPQYQTKQDAEDSDSSLPINPHHTPVLSCETPVLNYLTASNHTQLIPRLKISVIPGATVDAEVWFTRAGVFKYTY